MTDDKSFRVPPKNTEKNERHFYAQNFFENKGAPKKDCHLSYCHTETTTNYLISNPNISIKKILSFDLEWSLNKDEFGEHPILAAGFYDSHDYQRAFLREDFIERDDLRRAEKALLTKIISLIEKYNWSLGFYTTGVRSYNPSKHKVTGRDSDLIQLNKRLHRYNLKSPIQFSKNGKPYIVLKNVEHTHLDAHRLFSNRMVKASIYKGIYNGNDLDTISKAILGSEGGKFDGLSGPDFETLSDLDEKRKYVLRDAELVMKCVANNNYELLHVINSISKLTGISFRNVWNSGGVTGLWTPILDGVVKDKLSTLDGEGKEEDAILFESLYEYYERNKNSSADNHDDEDDEDDDDEPRYIGGWNKLPVPGEYKNVSEFDVASLYPTMIVNNNISFETVNCKCCQDIETAKVPRHIFDDKKETPNWHICTKHKEGILTKQIEHYMAERLEYKRLSKQDDLDEATKNQYILISDAYKILMNSVYGQMGHKFAKYENVVAAELVTRFGRITIQNCVKLAKDVFNWEIIYGDTDSLFVNNADSIAPEDIKIFMDTCKKKFNIIMELDKVYSKFLITKKKNYAGIIKDSNKIIVKGLAGKKSDRCIWVRKAFEQMLNDYRDNIDPYINLDSEIAKLESHSLENPKTQLIMSKTLGMNVDEYKVNCVQKLLGTKLGLQEGDTVRYFIIDGTKENNNTKYAEYVNEASIKQYKKQLINTVKPILKLLGIDAKKELDTPASTTAAVIEPGLDLDTIAAAAPIISLKEKSKIKNIKPKTGMDKYRLIQI
jgi:DNA polymerase, archaea type